MISMEAAEAHVKQMEEMLSQILKDADPSKDADPYAIGGQLFQYFQWFKKYEKYLEALLEGLRSREALTTLVASLPDEVGAQLPEAAALFKSVPPIWLRTMMDFSHHVAKANPMTGGRRELMKDIETKREICKEILQLYSEGVPLGVAHERIAVRYGISPRKIQRIWRERLTFQSAEPRTIADLY